MDRTKETNESELGLADGKIMPSGEAGTSRFSALRYLHGPKVKLPENRDVPYLTVVGGLDTSPRNASSSEMWWFSIVMPVARSSAVLAFK